MAQKHTGVQHAPLKAKNRENKPEYLSAIIHKKSLSFEEKKLHRSVTTNNTESVINLLTTGVNPNAADNMMRRPLHLAASRGYKDVVSVLIKYGADPNQKDIIGNTPLHLAACTNNIEIVTLLLDAGTDVNSLDFHGRNPLQLAQSKLKMLQNGRKSGAVELTPLRIQMQQVIDLMLSYLRRQQSDVEQLEIMKLKLDESSDAQLDDQMSLLLTAIQDISIK